MGHNFNAGSAIPDFDIKQMLVRRVHRRPRRNSYPGFAPGNAGCRSANHSRRVDLLCVRCQSGKTSLYDSIVTFSGTADTPQPPHRARGGLAAPAKVHRAASDCIAKVPQHIGGMSRRFPLSIANDIYIRVGAGFRLYSAGLMTAVQDRVGTPYMRRKHQTLLPLSVAAALLLAASAVAEDWPQWLGPWRTGRTSDKSGWAEGWPPVRLWDTSVGYGYTSPVIADDNLYVLGWGNGTAERPTDNPTGKDTVFCFNSQTGKEVWRQTYETLYRGRRGTGDANAYGGPTATPSFDDDTKFLYTLGADGFLACWNTAAAGAKVWSHSLHDEYTILGRSDTGNGQRDFGFTVAPLVYGASVLVEVGAEEGLVMAFDKKTGERLWASQAREAGGHTGGMSPCRAGWLPGLAVYTLRNLIMLRLDPEHVGETYTTFPWQTDLGCNIPTPALLRNGVILTSGHNQEKTVAVTTSGTTFTPMWTSREHASVSSPVVADKRVFLVNSTLRALDLYSGELLWSGGSFGDGSCILTGDDKLIVFGQGSLALVDAFPEENEYRELARIDHVVPGLCYPHVAMSEGIVACKDRDGNLACYSVRSDAPKFRTREQAEYLRNKYSYRRSRPALPSLDPGVALHDAEAPEMTESWPGNTDGCIFLWKGGPSAQFATGENGALVEHAMTPCGNAKLLDDGAVMDVTAGSFLAEAGSAVLLSACQEANQLSIEAVVQTSDLEQSGPARIVSFSISPSARNFTLGQQSGKFMLRLRTSASDLNGSRFQQYLCSVKPGRPTHLIVSYSPGRLVCYRNGKRVEDTAAMQGDFSNWSAHHLLLGDEWGGDRDWSGQLKHVAIHNRVIGSAEAKLRYRLSRGTDDEGDDE